MLFQLSRNGGSDRTRKLIARVTHIRSRQFVSFRPPPSLSLSRSLSLCSFFSAPLFSSPLEPPSFSSPFSHLVSGMRSRAFRVKCRAYSRGLPRDESFFLASTRVNERSGREAGTFRSFLNAWHGTLEDPMPSNGQLFDLASSDSPRDASDSYELRVSAHADRISLRPRCTLRVTFHDQGGHDSGGIHVRGFRKNGGGERTAAVSVISRTREIAGLNNTKLLIR